MTNTYVLILLVLIKLITRLQRLKHLMTIGKITALALIRIY